MSKIGASKKSLDTLWIVDELLGWNEQLCIPFDQGMYERVLWRLGMLPWARTFALTERERVAMFVSACDVPDTHDPGRRFATEREGFWKDVECGLRERNHSLWKLGVLGLV